MTAPDDLIVRCPTALWRSLPDRLIVLCDNDAVLTMMGTAIDIWRLLEEPRAPRDLVAELAEGYGIDPRQIAGDVDTVLDQLVRSGAACLRSR